MTISLLHCPFCGGPAKQPHKFNTSGTTWIIECNTYCVGMRRGTKQEVVRDWNTRTLGQKPTVEGNEGVKI